MSLTNMYYELHYGNYPFEDYGNYDKTSATINHLRDNKLSDSTISKLIRDSKKYKYFKLEKIDPLYFECSLTKPYTFYYHSELRIQSPRPKWDPVTGEIKKENFYLEMKTIYTMRDLLHYFYINSSMSVGLRDEKRDAGGLKFLLKIYNNFDKIEAIDFLLHLIDYCKDQGETVLSPMDLRKHEQSVLDHLERVTNDAELYNINKIVWRSK